MGADPQEIVQRFNQAINNQDLEKLVALMTEDHKFIDSTGAEEQGKARMAASWEGFFAAFPDYQNVFEQFEVDGSRVAVRGYSHCSNEPALEGPAIWVAHVRDGRVSEWRVVEDTPENRREFCL